MVTIHADCLTYDVCSSDYSVLDFVSAKLLSMIYMYLGFGKVGFCEMFTKRGTLQKSGREVLREGIFENKKHYFQYKLCHSLRFISHVYCFNLFPRSGQFVGLTSYQIQHHSFCDSCSTLLHPSVLDCWIYLFLFCNPKFANTLRML